MATFLCILKDDGDNVLGSDNFLVTDALGRTWACSQTQGDYAAAEGEQMLSEESPEEFHSLIRERVETCARSELAARLSIDVEPLPEGS